MFILIIIIVIVVDFKMLMNVIASAHVIMSALIPKDLLSAVVILVFSCKAILIHVKVLMTNGIIIIIAL